MNSMAVDAQEGISAFLREEGGRMDGKIGIKEGFSWSRSSTGSTFSPES